MGSVSCLLAAGLLSACTADSAPALTPQAGVLQALATAEERGDASAEQIALLERARDEGRDITEQEFRSAYSLAVECARSAGVKVVQVDEIYSAGNLQLYMSINVTAENEDSMIAAMGACEHKHSAYLDISRQLSPSTKRMQDAIIASHLPAMLQCVRGKGANLEDGAAYEEIIADDPDLDDPAHSCVATSGLQAALDAPPAGG